MERLAKSFYPVVTIVIASYYVLFAVMGASTDVLVVEALVCVVFLAVAVTGFRGSLWVVVVALAAHGIFDLTHAAIVSNPGVPSWWPEFCLAYDVTAAAYLAWLLKSGRIHARVEPLHPTAHALYQQMRHGTVTLDLLDVNDQGPEMPQRKRQ